MHLVCRLIAQIRRILDINHLSVVIREVVETARTGMREGRLGHRESISRRYQHLRRQLDEQLGLKPEAATRALYHELPGQRWCSGIRGADSLRVRRTWRLSPGIAERKRQMIWRSPSNAAVRLAGAETAEARPLHKPSGRYGWRPDPWRSRRAGRGDHECNLLQYADTARRRATRVAQLGYYFTGGEVEAMTLLRDGRVVTGGSDGQVLTGNFPHLEGSNQPPSVAWLRGPQITWLDYGG